jgi:hypothetical protein
LLDVTVFANCLAMPKASEWKDVHHPYAIRLSRRASPGTEVFQIALLGRPAGHVVNYAHGLLGAKLKNVKATASPVSLAEAGEIYSGLVRSKVAEGYAASWANARRLLPKQLPRGVAAQRFVICSGGGKPFFCPVKQAVVRFSRKKNNLWSVGVGIESKEHGDDDTQMIVHLRDFPVHGIDVPTEPFRIHLEHGSDFAAALGRTWLTNLYYYEHTETEHNTIDVIPLAKGRYRVKWKAEGESMSDAFEVNCVARRMDRYRYP